MPAMRAIILRASLADRSPAARVRLATRKAQAATAATNEIASTVRLVMINSPES
jgi:hypothetical protein